MRVPTTPKVLFLSACLLAGGPLALPCEAQTRAADQEAAEDLSPAQLLRDFVHWVRIDSYDLAIGRGEALLARGLDPVEFVELVEETEGENRFVETVNRARRIDAQTRLNEVAIELDRLYERGRLDRARDPDEIGRNIRLLSEGTARGRILARERLGSAGEYAMPQLLEALLQGDDSALRAEVRGLLIAMGRQSIIPLGTALSDLAPEEQELVVNVLGQIEYETSVPFIVELRQTTGTDRVREACDRALARFGVRDAGDIAAHFRGLAEVYYAERSEVTSFPGEDHQLLWDFDPSVGLVPTAIRTPVYHEAMAMRMAERSLRARPEGNEALGLWLAANFSRELNTPEGYENPAYPDSRRDAMYFAVASGVEPCQWVLARAIDTRNTRLARRAIEALEQTAGADALRTAVRVTGDAGTLERRPLLEALAYPSRRVQYDAAITLGRAQPRDDFAGAERVVPLLAGAVRHVDERNAIVLAPGRSESDARERIATLREFLQRQGYTVFGGRSLREIQEPLATTAGVDLVLIDARPDDVSPKVDAVRAEPRLTAAPVMVLTSRDAYPRLSRQYRRDVGVEVRQTGLAESMMVSAIEDLVETAAGGPITPEEGRAYASRSLDVLRDLAISRNPVLDVSDAARPLIASLGERSGAVRLQVADVLAHIPQERTQVAVMEAALGASGVERVALLDRVADSAKRFGNYLRDRQVERLMRIAMAEDSAEATAAAAVMGALNLPNENLLPLILGEDEPAAARR